MKTACGFSRLIIAVGASVYLAGCATLAGNAAGTDKSADESTRQDSNRNTAASIETPLVSANDSLLAMMRYWRYINGLTTESLQAEFKRINDAYFIRPNDRTGLKRAMLLMMPGTDFYDLNQAKQLVADIIKSDDKSVPAFKEYAQFLTSIIESQQETNQRYTQLQDKLAQEQREREKIEQKLEALKSIEESMIQRRSE
jgi:hypothetical protein